MFLAQKSSFDKEVENSDSEDLVPPPHHCRQYSVSVVVDDDDKSELTCFNSEE